MKPENGSDYAQNYDIVVKWMADTLRGRTLEVLGLRTGRIEDVFGFEPSDIKVVSGRVDVMARDETGAIYHIEEQRHLGRSDFCRFAAYHFMAVGQWGAGVTDVILASGNVFAGKKEIETPSGTYRPVVVDFGLKDGAKRLEEIRRAVGKGEEIDWMELVFLPLCGREGGDLAERVLRFETELYRARKIPAKLLGATLVMSNRLIDRDRLEALWEEVKMLDILEIAREKGIQEGKSIGIREGKSLGIQEGKSIGIQEGKTLGILENTRQMVADALIEKFGIIPLDASERIRNIGDLNALKALFRQVFRCETIEAFEEILRRL